MNTGRKSHCQPHNHKLSPKQSPYFFNNFTSYQQKQTICCVIKNYTLKCGMKEKKKIFVKLVKLDILLQEAEIQQINN